VRIVPPAGLAPIPETKGCAYTVFGEGALWSVLADSPFFLLTDYYVVRVDPETRRINARVRIPELGERYSPKSFDVGEGAVWIAFDGFPARIHKIDPVAGRVVATIPVGARGFSRHAARLAVGEGAVWAVIPGEKFLYRVDPQRNEVTPIQLGYQVGDVFVGAGSVWVRHPREDALSRIDPRTHRLVATISAPPSMTYRLIEEYPSFRGRWMTMAAGAMWVLLSEQKWPLPTVVGRLDLQSNRFVATVDAGANLTDIATSGTAIVAASFHAERGFSPTAHLSIIEIDPTTNAVKRSIPFGSVSGVGGSASNFLAVGAAAVWVCLPYSGIYRLPFVDESKQQN
jgi:hypothetical protein